MDILTTVCTRFFLQYDTGTNIPSFVELGPGGKAGVKTSPFTPVPAGLNSTPEQLAKYQELADNDHGDTDNVVSWHCDAYPFVCVLMLSDVTEMIGGETALQVSFAFVTASTFYFDYVY